MKKTIDLISDREKEILIARNVELRIVEKQTEEMIETEGTPFSLNNFASNAAPSHDHFIRENKNKSKIIIKDVDTGIGEGKFRIAITFE